MSEYAYIGPETVRDIARDALSHGIARDAVNGRRTETLIAERWHNGWKHHHVVSSGRFVDIEALATAAGLDVSGVAAVVTLRSYDEDVVAYLTDRDGQIVAVWATAKSFSRTTDRHQREGLRNVLTLPEWRAMRDALNTDYVSDTLMVSGEDGHARFGVRRWYVTAPVTPLDVALYA